ncbi:hypothetical protein [Burkholderia sp. Ac-20353]|uniref:hypothetical protein n=1 Tax=Burkholderia sp. Ac-20353 TaxID=2703894 RepID=UPI00197B65DE|nr:hypothetical protein [Burkholderia sp. Ac-20353]MBN3791008.1 hypothetical protein [Burkholderia sp. Ac-20353]
MAGLPFMVVMPAGKMPAGRKILQQAAPYLPCLVSRAAAAPDTSAGGAGQPDQASGTREAADMRQSIRETAARRVLRPVTNRHDSPRALFCRPSMTYRKNIEHRAIRRATSSAFAKWPPAHACIPWRLARIHPFG